MNKNDRYVVRHGKEWAVVKAHAERASAVVGTQKAAERIAKSIVENAGGGEVRIQGMDSKFRDSDTVAPGNESPTKDAKH